jgi:hypothetical protein
LLKFGKGEVDRRYSRRRYLLVRHGVVIASAAKQSSLAVRSGLLRRFAPRNDAD